MPKATQDPDELAGPDADQRTQRVIEMYLDGQKLADITRETSVPRATIYWLLRRNGISTNRVGQMQGDSVSASELLARLQESERINGALRDKVEKLETLVAYLSTFTQAVRPSSTSAGPSRPRTQRKD